MPIGSFTESLHPYTGIHKPHRNAGKRCVGLCRVWGQGKGKEREKPFAAAATLHKPTRYPPENRGAETPGRRSTLLAAPGPPGQPGGLTHPIPVWGRNPALAARSPLPHRQQQPDAGQGERDCKKKGGFPGRHHRGDKKKGAEALPLLPW